MKKVLVCFSAVLLLTPVLSFRASAQDPMAIIIKQAVKKVIVGVDLKIQRLQTKTIWLQNAQKVVENTMSKLKLDDITGWIQKQKDLYQTYFDELRQVKNALRYYHRIKALTLQQAALVKEYKRAWLRVKQDNHFSAGELRYISQVYTGIVEESLDNIDQLSLVIQSLATQMSDAGRLEILNRTADAMQQNYTDLNAFTTQTIQLSLLRSKDTHDITAIKALYGIHQQ